MLKLTALMFVVLGALATASCGDHSMPTQPTTFSTSAGSGPTFTVQPAMLIAQPADHFSCPAVPPFTVPFQLILNTSDPRLIVTTITARFVDTSGAQMPQVTLPAPVPTTPFGSALTELRDMQFSIALGCVTGHNGTLTLVVVTQDGHGKTGSSQVTVGVH